MGVAHIARHGKSLVVAAVFGTAILGVGWRQQQELPEARKIVDRYVEAIGGEDLIRSMNGQRIIGRMEVPAQGIGGDLEVYAAAPDKVLLKIEVPGLGAIASGFDGQVGWTINPAMGPMVLEDRQLDQMRQQADFYGALHREEFIASMETVEKTEFEGHAAYKVKVVTTWGEEYFEFFDAESGLMVGQQRTQASPMGDIPTTNVMSDYKEFDGLLVPTRSVQRMMGIEQVISVTSIEAWKPDAATFALPPEIKALMTGAGQ